MYKNTRMYAAPSASASDMARNLHGNHAAMKGT